jgi:hypothetical protein
MCLVHFKNLKWDEVHTISHLQKLLLDTGSLEPLQHKKNLFYVYCTVYFYTYCNVQYIHVNHT